MCLPALVISLLVVKELILLFAIICFVAGVQTMVASGVPVASIPPLATVCNAIICVRIAAAIMASGDIVFLLVFIVVWVSLYIMVRWAHPTTRRLESLSLIMIVSHSTK